MNNPVMLSSYRPDPEDRLTSLYRDEGLSREVIRLFRRIIRVQYRKAGRVQPWRETSDPYHILVSEIMLQQTQVERVLGKYRQFITRFPDFHSLARAPLSSVLILWQGLGYNRRAVLLHRLAQQVVTLHGGLLPGEREALLGLPGIGPYTAGAVLAFAFNIPAVFIETNIRRVFLHFFFPDETSVSDREIAPLVETTVDRRDPRSWYYGLMDYGSELKKKVANPNRRSSHYTRQSPFEGSRRQVRARLLRLVLRHPGSTAASLARLSEIETALAREILRELAVEGFLVMKNRRYSAR